ncbi:hypothetical protein [Robertkochia solimangrovi]|uniref:hypothetical protein n=1 Tax=Robertkochia solimangrovi TaxID=2213046 RepID=UPI00117F9048|nr:hypothetical protein [Robertkochia solimangrovi]TRZ45003.1 hypothetical protein DMZ48_04370 [Robertkochia solimangrovi]
MKKFLIKNLTFVSIFIIIFYLKPCYLLFSNNFKNTVAGNEVYISLDKSKDSSNCKILILGDSVGNQIFSNTCENDTINSLACNQAIGIVGHYLLLNNYINTGNTPESVFLVYTPFSFLNNLNQKYTFHYFLKPFNTNEYSDLFTQTVHDQITKIPYFWLSQEPYILTSNWSPNYESDKEINYTFLSPISKEYITKMKQLCLENKIDFHIIPTPTRISNKKRVLNLDKDEFQGLNIEYELNQYLNSIVYKDDSLYIDDVHLKYPQKFKSPLLNLMNQFSSFDNSIQ